MQYSKEKEDYDNINEDIKRFIKKIVADKLGLYWSQLVKWKLVC